MPGKGLISRIFIDYPGQDGLCFASVDDPHPVPVPELLDQSVSEYLIQAWLCGLIANGFHIDLSDPYRPGGGLIQNTVAASGQGQAYKKRP